MILISLKSSKRIVKGIRYEAESIDNNHPIHPGQVYIKDIGWYSAKNFSDINGNPIPRIKTARPQTQPMLQDSDIQVGDILVCITDNFSTFKEGSRYEIERIDVIKGFYSDRSKVKFKDIKRTIYFNPWSFRKMNTTELRTMALNKFFNEAEEEITKPVVLKEKVLMELLSKSILDRNRHHFSILDWGIEQLSNKKIKKNDYDSLMEMKLKDILEILETNNK